jgi:small subunit ribosomal protein S20
MAADAKNKKAKTPTAEKRNIQSEKRRVMNKAFKSHLRTAIRNFEESLKKEDKEVMGNKLKEAHSALDKAAKRGILKPNAASRKKSRLAAHAKKALTA